MPTVRKTEIRLADGRTLRYYDEASHDRTAADRRPLSEAQTHSQARYDQLLGDWVVIASHRQGRTFLPPADACPLCPSGDDEHLTEIPAADYDVVVFDNRFPSLSTATAAAAEQAGLFVAKPGNGKCEVVCFTSEHGSSFAQLTPSRVGTVIEAWVDRTRELSQLNEVQQVFPFENRGVEIGVTLAHPHGQIYAYPFLPPPARALVNSARAHRVKTGRCLACDLLEAERSARERVVVESEHWTAFVPYAARWPYEVHVYPRRHVPDLPALSDVERVDLAEVYLDVLGRFESLFETPTPYIAAWMQAPAHEGHELAHLHLRVFTVRRAPGKLKYLAGSESGMGVFINDVVPEQAAARLRDRALA